MNRLLWLRQEDRPSERRTPLVPSDAAGLVGDGVRVVVERCDRRVFGDDEYADAGCELVEPGSWVDAPLAAVVLGIKELPPGPDALPHRHVYFGHAYKGQAGASELLARFVRGGGQLLDLEYLTDAGGRRLAAFGYWAGYVGAALGVLELAGRLTPPVAATARDDLDVRLAEAGAALADGSASALVIGAAGRSGRGALDALGVAGVEAAGWDIEETAQLDRAALLGHDLLVNCVLATSPVPPFVRAEDAASGARRLSVIADITCDVHSEINVLPVNTDVTTWEAPVRDVGTGERPLWVIAIDNLPSVLPREASVDFSAQLARCLPGLWTESDDWTRAALSFHRATQGMDAD